MENNYVFYLTRRERQILLAIAQGKTSREIAAGFGTKLSTVADQRKTLLTKLGVGNSRALIDVAKQRCLLRGVTVSPIQPIGEFTEQERIVLEYAAQGLSVAETASRMGIGPRTVDTYLFRVRRKLHNTKVKKWQLAEAAGIRGGAPLELRPAVAELPVC